MCVCVCVWVCECVCVGGGGVGVYNGCSVQAEAVGRGEVVGVRQAAINNMYASKQSVMETLKR